MGDSLATGRTFRTLNIVDDFSREALALEVDHGPPGVRVVRVLDRLLETPGRPEQLVTDNGPEFTRRALDEWAYRNGVRLHFISPGRPMENAYVESFNGKFRDECLNEHWFVDLRHACKTIDVWRQDYNEFRPHSSIGNIPPSEYAAAHAGLRS